MSLAALQSDFMSAILTDDEAPRQSWKASAMAAGIEVYRNGYRERHVDALAETFPRTKKWVSEDSFNEAAIHHLILHPPQSWTLDLAGSGFPGTLSELFANDPEVAELGWIEWAMHIAFTAADARPLDHHGFARTVAGFVETDWAGMKITFLPGAALNPVAYDCIALWQGLEGEAIPATHEMLEDEGFCLIWRDGLKPVCQIVGAREGGQIKAVLGGATFGELCSNLAVDCNDDVAAQEAGGFLGRWIAMGLVHTISA